MSKNTKKILRKKKRVSQTLPIIAMLAALGVSSLTYSVTASADSGTSTTTRTSIHMSKGRKQAVGGTVTAVSGTDITVTTPKHGTYTVDASHASFVKFVEPSTAGTRPATTSATISDVVVGVNIMTRGTVSGTHAVATQVVIGTGLHAKPAAGNKVHSVGKPAASGVIQSIDGSLVTIKDKDNKTYIVDVSSAKILRGGRGQAATTIIVSDLKVGDMLGAKGTLTGATVVATDVMTSSPHAFMQRLHKTATSTQQ